MRMEMSVVTALVGIETIWMFDFDGTISELFQPRRGGDPPGLPRPHPDLAAVLPARAILSSRLLEDVVRGAHPGVYLGGGSGMEWRRPAAGDSLPTGAARR